MVGATEIFPDTIKDDKECIVDTVAPAMGKRPRLTCVESGSGGWSGAGELE